MMSWIDEICDGGRYVVDLHVKTKDSKQEIVVFRGSRVERNSGFEFSFRAKVVGGLRPAEKVLREVRAELDEIGQFAGSLIYKNKKKFENAVIAAIKRYKNFQLEWLKTLARTEGHYIYDLKRKKVPYIEIDTNGRTVAGVRHTSEREVDIYASAAFALALKYGRQAHVPCPYPELPPNFQFCFVRDFVEDGDSDDGDDTESEYSDSDEEGDLEDTDDDSSEYSDSDEEDDEGGDDYFAPRAPFGPLVKGKGFCWAKVWFLPPDWVFSRASSGVHLSEFLHEFEKFQKTNPKRAATLEFQFFLQEDGDFHVAGVRMPQLSGGSPTGKFYQTTPKDHPWLSFKSVVDIMRTTLDEYRAICLSPYAEPFVGSAPALVEESSRINGPEFAKLAAQEAFNNDLASTPKTNLRLSQQQLAGLSKYLGYPIMSNNKYPATNDHVFLEVARQMLRRHLEAKFPHNTDVFSVLHIGSTMQEVKAWLSHPGHDFSFQLSESKDLPRIFEDMNKMIAAKVKGLPSVTSRRGATTRVKWDNIQDGMRVLEAGRKRFFFPDSDRMYDVLFAEDCLYNASQKEIGALWEKHNFKVGYATMFFPDALISDDAAISDIYNYEEYYSLVETAEKFVEDIWPGILLFTPLFPIDLLNQAIHDFAKWLYTSGWDLFKNWLTGVANSAFPFELIVGNLFDIAKWKSILLHVFSTMKKWFRYYFGRARVTWKGGFSTGYDHRVGVWSDWLFERRFRTPSGHFVEVEVVAREGEMYLLKLFSSEGTTPLPYTVGIPISRRTVSIARLEAAWNSTTKTLGDIEYFNVLEEDWFTLLNWAMAEPVDSLTPALMCHNLNRIRGGLSVGSNLIVAPMHIHSRDVVDFALAALFEVYRRQDIIGMINDSQEIRNSYETNLKRLGKDIARLGLALVSGGLAYPLWMVFKWLVTENPRFEFVRYHAEPKTRMAPRAGPGRFGGGKVNTSFETVVAHSEDKLKTGCMLCDLQAHGVFSKDGVPANGQELIHQPAKEENSHNFGFSPAEMPVAVNYIRDVRNQHGQAKVVKYIKQLEDFLEANMGGIEHQITIHSIKGGPGTGKTEIIKSLANHLQKNGINASICVPFKALCADYVKAEVLGESTRVTFQADTPWYCPQRSNVQVFIVDEKTAVDIVYIKAMMCYLGAKELYVVGDSEQTRLRAEANEGVDITNPLSTANWDAIDSHELIWNFRMGAWRVKCWNKVFGYRMKAKRNDMDVPKFMTVEQYNEYRRDNIVERCFVFAHRAALQVFGIESTADPGEDNVNMSVRSAQGKTVKTAAISASELDDPVWDAHGMLNVAGSRSKEAPIFVTPGSLDDYVISSIRARLCCDSEEKIEGIKRMPWPEIENPTPKIALTSEQTLINGILTQKQRFGKVLEDTPNKEVPVLVEQLDPSDDVFSICSRAVIRVDPWAFWKKIFHFCLVDVIRTQRPDKDKELLAYLKAAYSSSEFHNLLKGDGKTYLDLYDVLKILALPFIIVNKGEKEKISENARNVPKDQIVKITLNGSHVTSYQEVQLPARAGGVDLGMVNEFDISGGRFNFEYLLRGVVSLPSVPIVPVGHLPSIVVETKPTFPSRQLDNWATARADVTSSYVLNEDTKSYVKRPFTRTPFRFGMDGYKLASLFDPSGASSRPMLNECGPVSGPSKEKFLPIQINWDGFNNERTKSGKIRVVREKFYRSCLPGLGNHFNNSPVESLIAAQRVTGNGKKPRLNAETKAWAKKVADNVYESAWLPNYKCDPDRYNKVIVGALKDAKTRNYHGRALAERAKTWKHRLTLSNKDQFKPMKDGKLDLFKGGQVLMQSPPTVNFEYIGWMRGVGNRMKESLRPEYFMDDYEAPSDFRSRLTQSARNLPNSVRTGIADARCFDAQQNEVTVEIEKQIALRMGETLRNVTDYYVIRGNIDFFMFGIFRGQTDGAKGSGFLDTKPGNTKLQMALAEWCMSGVGPKVVAAKGDDYARLQSGLKIDDQRRAEIKKFAGMEIVFELGDGGEFCGDTISRIGMFPSITRAARKAIAQKSRDYTHFTEQQKAFRDKIKEYIACGLQETIHYSALAEGVSISYVELGLAILNSFGHISKDQWLECTKLRTNPRFFLPRRFGPTLI